METPRGCLAHILDVGLDSAFWGIMGGERDSSFWSAAALGGLVSFWRAREVGTAPSCVRTHWERLSPGRGEINGKPGQLASPPLNASYSDSILPSGRVKTDRTIKPETEDIKKFSMALRRLNCVLVKLLIAYTGHGTVRSDPVGEPRCMVLPGWCSVFFMLLFINLNSSREDPKAGGLGMTLLFMKWPSASANVEIAKCSGSP